MSRRGVLVTGGAQGIGLAITQAAVAAGDDVVVVDQRDFDASIWSRMDGANVTLVLGDASDADTIAHATDIILTRAGSLDVAVNNAGVAGPHRPIYEFSDEDFEQIMGVNVRGVFVGLRQELRIMMSQGSGAIVNMASALGLVGAEKQAVYSASKHAVVGMTRAAALDAKSSGVRVNCVCPGVIGSPLTAAAIAADPALGEVWQGLHPLGRLGEANEVAKAVMWLASEEASFVTGAAISVDGGYTSR